MGRAGGKTGVMKRGDYVMKWGGLLSSKDCPGLPDFLGRFCNLFLAVFLCGIYQAFPSPRKYLVILPES
jgi:hypothetical protein